MKRRLISALMLLAILTLNACASKPKNKCNTCPKWTSENPVPYRSTTA